MTGNSMNAARQPTGDVTPAQAAGEASATAGRDASSTPIVPGPAVPGRAVRVAAWLGWHLVEITGIAGAVVVAVTLTPWAWLFAGLVLAWTVHAGRKVSR